MRLLLLTAHGAGKLDGTAGAYLAREGKRKKRREEKSLTRVVAELGECLQVSLLLTDSCDGE